MASLDPEDFSERVLFDRNVLAAQIEKSPLSTEEITDIGPEEEISALAELVEDDIWCCSPPKVVAFAEHGDPNEPLHFGAAFESGNLFFASRVADGSVIELEMVFDPGPVAISQWFYFAIHAKRGLAAKAIRFQIVNFTRSQSVQLGSAFSPLTWSATSGSSDGGRSCPGWKYCVTDVSWFRTEPARAARALARQGKVVNAETDSIELYTLSFTYIFDTCGVKGDEIAFFAYSVPYTVSHLRRFLGWLQGTAIKKKVMSFKRSALCSTEGDNHCELLKITETQYCEQVPRGDYGRQSSKEQQPGVEDKPILLLLGRQCSGSTSGSWALQGLLHFLAGDSQRAQALRIHFEIICVPMIDVDGVLAGFQEVMSRACEESSAMQYPAFHALNDLVQDLINSNRKIACVIDFNGQPSRRDAFFRLMLDANSMLQPARGVDWCFSELPSVASTCSVDINSAKFSDAVRQQTPSTLQTILGQTSCAAVFNLEVSHFGPTSLAKRLQIHRTKILPMAGRYPRARWLTLAQDRRVRRFFYRGVGYCSIRLGSVGLSVGHALFLCSGLPIQTSERSTDNFAHPSTTSPLSGAQIMRSLDDLENEELTPWTPREDCPALRMTADLPPLEIIAPEALGSRPLENSCTKKELFRGLLENAPRLPSYNSLWKHVASHAPDVGAASEKSAFRSVRQLAWKNKEMCEAEALILNVPQPPRGSYVCSRNLTGRCRCCSSFSRRAWDANDGKVFRRYCPWLTLGDAPVAPAPEVARPKEDIVMKLPVTSGPATVMSSAGTNGWIGSETSTACESIPCEDASVDSCSEVSFGSLDDESDMFSDDSWASEDWSCLNSPRTYTAEDFSQEQETQSQECSSDLPPPASSSTDVEPAPSTPVAEPVNWPSSACRGVDESLDVMKMRCSPGASSTRQSRLVDRACPQEHPLLRASWGGSLPSLIATMPPMPASYHLRRLKWPGEERSTQVSLSSGTRSGGFRRTRTSIPQRSLMHTLSAGSLPPAADSNHSMSLTCGPAFFFSGSAGRGAESPAAGCSASEALGGHTPSQSLQVQIPGCDFVLPQPSSGGSPHGSAGSPLGSAGSPSGSRLGIRSMTSSQARRSKNPTDLPLLLDGRRLARSADGLTIQSVSPESKNSGFRPAWDSISLLKQAGVMHNSRRVSVSRGQ